MASVTLNSLHKSFGTVRAVQDVTLDIHDGEFISLLGPSGCGKTTTLRMVAGLEASDGGQILIGDKDVSVLPPRDRDVAMVFQDYALYPHMNVLENVGYPLKVRGVRSAELEARVTAVAKRLQIDALLERRPAQLSGGQQQRVALARAVVHHAKVTLYDEPLSNLDTQLRNEARIFLRHLQKEVGLTSLYVTHDQAEAMALSDRIVVMNQGKVMQFGSPMDVYRKPVNTFVASFIGSPPMNLLHCQIDQAAHRLVFDDAATLPLSMFEARYASILSSLSSVKLGVRPEHIHLHTTPGEDRLPARPYITQELGSEIHLIVHINDQLVTVRLPGDQPVAYSEQVWLEFQPERIYFYDGDGLLVQ